MTDERVWEIRAIVYQHFATTGAPPSVESIAETARMSSTDAQEVLERLHELHALFLDPETRTIRIANPFSGVPTRFQVTSGNVSYWANCAWDALGIPAALHADARIEAPSVDSDVPVQLIVEKGQLRGDDAIAHFSVPVRHWYDDLIHT